MGAYQSGKAAAKAGPSEEVNFDHFQILRAIGRGSFGKVCIVQKKDSKKLFAMKYMSKRQCAERATLHNVLREVDILRALPPHPCLVNLWFSFHDEEDLFLVSDLLLGGDLRYHVARGAAFAPSAVRLCVCELAAALDFLQSRRILHRDIKPDNILLDEEGHVHLTDFNIAIVLEEGQLATSMSGTKPYMAPEIFACAVDECAGYSFPVDWWSLGVCAFEMLQGSRPFDIHSATSISDVRALFSTGLHYPAHWSHGMKDLISRLLCVQPGGRISSFNELRTVQCLNHIELDDVLQKKVKPSFVPPKNHLNCDPTYELEEMIIEAKPLHKKKKRLAKQRSLREIQGSLSIDMEMDLTNEVYLQQLPTFKPYNRELEILNREREIKEQSWEEELRQAMEASQPVEVSSGCGGKGRPNDTHSEKGTPDTTSSPQSDNFSDASVVVKSLNVQTNKTVSQKNSQTHNSEKLLSSTNLQPKPGEMVGGHKETGKRFVTEQITSTSSSQVHLEKKVQVKTQEKSEHHMVVKRTHAVGCSEKDASKTYKCEGAQQNVVMSECVREHLSGNSNSERTEGEREIFNCSPFPKGHIVKACVSRTGKT